MGLPPSRPKFASSSVIEVRELDIFELAAKTDSSTVRRAVLPMHRSSEDVIQEMVVALSRSAYLRPYQHLVPRSESFHVMQELMTLVYPRLVAKFSKIPLLVIDEWLRNPLSAEQSREILDLIDERYQKLSTVFCSQLPVKSWHQAIKDPTAADAILDRIVHHSHRIELAGDSLRKSKAHSVVETKGVASLR